MKATCKTCNYYGSTKRKGNFAITFILLIMGIIPGIIYEFWRGSGPGVCGRCGSHLIVLDYDKKPNTKTIFNKRTGILAGVLFVFILLALPYMVKSDLDKTNNSVNTKTEESGITSDGDLKNNSNTDLVGLENFKHEKAQEFVKSLLSDPSSAEFRNQNGFCGEVNSKNSFGGFTGFRRFMASEQLVALEGVNMESSEFENAWRQVCVN